MAATEHQHQQRRARAQAAAAEGRWRAADAELRAVADADLVAEDQMLLADAAFWRIDVDDEIELRQAAFAAFVAEGRPRRAAYTAWLLAVRFGRHGDPVSASGWQQRAERQLEGHPDCIEASYVACGTCEQALLAGRLDDAEQHARAAVESGHRHGEPELLSLALSWEGLCRISGGDLDGGARCLDEAMAAVCAGEVDPSHGLGGLLRHRHVRGRCRSAPGRRMVGPRLVVGPSASRADPLPGHVQHQAGRAAGPAGRARAGRAGGPPGVATSSASSASRPAPRRHLRLPARAPRDPPAAASQPAPPAWSILTTRAPAPSARWLIQAMPGIGTVRTLTGDDCDPRRAAMTTTRRGAGALPRRDGRGRRGGARTASGRAATAGARRLGDHAVPRWLTPEQAACLADDTSPTFVAAGALVTSSNHKDVERVCEAFRGDGGIGWGDHHEDLFTGTERFFQPVYRVNLVAGWIPALDGVEAKLVAGARVADVGCGLGVPLRLLAEAYPASTFVGFDARGPSVDAARAEAAAAGVADRVTFAAAGAEDFDGGPYDLVCVLNALHEWGDPLAAVRHIRSSLTPDGKFMFTEPGTDAILEATTRARTFFSVSTIVCTPSALSQGAGDRALGAQAGEAALRDVVTGAGFRHVRRAAETPSFVVLEARP